MPAPPLVPSSAAAAKVNHYLGTPLSGPRLVAPEAVRTDDALAIDVKFIALERVPLSAIDPLGSHARMIIANHHAAPVRATANLTRNAGYADGMSARQFADAINRGAYGRATVVAQLSATVSAGSTAVFVAADSLVGQAIPATGVTRRQFVVDVSRPPTVDAGAATQPTTYPTTGPVTDTLDTPAAPSTQPSTQPVTAPTAVPSTLPTTAPDVAAPLTPATNPSSQPTTPPLTLPTTASSVGTFETSATGLASQPPTAPSTLPTTTASVTGSEIPATVSGRIPVTLPTTAAADIAPGVADLTETKMKTATPAPRRQAGRGIFRAVDVRCL